MPAVTLNPYELREIYTVLQDRQYPTPTELQSRFAGRHLFRTKALDLDEVFPDLRISQWVGAKSSAVPNTLRGYKTKTLYPGYTRQKATVNFDDLRLRAPGEPYNVGKSNAGQIAAKFMEHMAVMEAKHSRLLENTCASIMLYGSYVAESEQHPKIVVDLEPNIATNAATLNNGRANRANLTATAVTLPTGGTLPVINDNGANGKRAWGSTGGTAAVSPVSDLQAMLDAAWEPIEVIYISDNAYKELIKDPLFNTSNTSLHFSTAMDAVALSFTPRQYSKEGLKYRGAINGIPMYTYKAGYQAITDSVDTLSQIQAYNQFIPDGWVVMLPSSSYAVQAYGAIQHGEADFEPMEIFWNSWTDSPEFGINWLQMQSAPLMLHTKINSTVAWKVM